MFYDVVVLDTDVPTITADNFEKNMRETLEEVATQEHSKVLCKPGAPGKHI